MGGIFMTIGDRPSGLKAWKLVDEEHADAVAAGSVLLGTFASYSALENGRSDTREAMLTIKLPGYMKVGKDIPGSADIARRLGVDLGDGGEGNEIGELEVTWMVPPMWVYCMAARGCDFDPSPVGPKAIFEIADVPAFIESIAVECRDRVAKFWVNPVTYGGTTVGVHEGQTRRASPFVKDFRFRFERELRCAFEPIVKVQEREDFHSMKLGPNPARAALLSRVFWPLADRRTKALPQRLRRRELLGLDRQVSLAP